MATELITAKPAWQSKTLWVALIQGVLPLVYPPAAAWIALNPTLYAAGLTVVFSALRAVSKGSISIL